MLGVSIMRCIACGAEMRLMEVVEDNTMMVPGYEHHIFMCTFCPEVERRLTFRSQNAQDAPDATPVSPASPSGETANQWVRALARLRGKRPPG